MKKKVIRIVVKSTISAVLGIIAVLGMARVKLTMEEKFPTQRQRIYSEVGEIHFAVKMAKRVAIMEVQGRIAHDMAAFTNEEIDRAKDLSTPYHPRRNPYEDFNIEDARELVEKTHAYVLPPNCSLDEELDIYNEISRRARDTSREFDYDYPLGHSR